MTVPDTAARAGRIGRTAVEALAGLLDIPAGPILAAGVLPPMWHCAQLPDIRAQAELGPDGHPLGGVPSPPRPGMRRMFAGGRAAHLAPLRIGEPAARRTTVVNRAEKQGKSGPLTFVTVRNTYEQDGQAAVVDEQDIVYRPPAGDPVPAGTGGSSGLEPPGNPRLAGRGAVRGLTVDPVVLFRFSALTVNSHRIHYDRPYAATEGYPDLLVHGPLQVLVMAEALRAAGVRLAGRLFEYRLQSPAVGPQQLTARLAVNERGEDTVVLAGSVSGSVATARVCEP
jgi:3-methylfumaryl-CoA hydratase